MRRGSRAARKSALLMGPLGDAARGIRQYADGGFDVLERAMDRAVPEDFRYESEAGIARQEVRRKRILQHPGMPLIRRKPRSFRGRLEDAEKLAAIQRAALLTCKQRLRTVVPAHAEPRLKRLDFVK